MKSNTSNRRPLRLAVLGGVISAAMVLTGCASTGPAEPEPSGSAAPVVAEPMKIRIGYGSQSYQSAEIFVAQDAGLFEKYNLDVELVKLNGSSQIATTIKSGGIDIGQGDSTATAVGILKGIEMTFIGGNVDKYSLEMWAGPGIETIKDLKGKTLGSALPGSLTDVALTAVLAEFGMTRADIKVVNFQDATAKLAAMTTGKVDGMLTQPPTGGDTLANSGAKVIYDTSDIPNQTVGYVTSPDFAKNHKDAIIAFLKATREADVLLKTAPDKVKPIMAKWTKVDDEALNEHGFQFWAKLFTIDPTIDIELLSENFKLAAATTKTDFVKVDVASHYDDQFAKALRDSGFIEEMESKAK